MKKIILLLILICLFSLVLAEEKTTEQIKEILLDWKGCGKSRQRQELINIIENSGLQFKRTSAIEK